MPSRENENRLLRHLKRVCNNNNNSNDNMHDNVYVGSSRKSLPAESTLSAINATGSCAYFSERGVYNIIKIRAYA